MHLLIAAADWRTAIWQEQFFPPDLPPQWRLDFYANEFRAWLVPAAVWSAATHADLLAWREAAVRPFAFFLELPADICVADGAELNHAVDVANVLGEELAGIVVSGGDTALLAEVNRVVQGHFPGQRCTLLCRDPIGPVASGAGLSLCQGDGAVPCIGGELAVAWLNGPVEPRALREVLEQLTQGNQTLGLVVSEHLDTLRQVRLIADMAGLS